MKTLTSLAIVLLLFFNCSPDTDVQTVEMEPQLTDVLSLELAFGADDEKIPEDYLLVEPRGIIIHDNGDIIVSDEGYLKVFDKNGNPKRMVGRPGAGPGEFHPFMTPTLSETGYITGANQTSFNLFDKNYSLIEYENFRLSSIYEKLKEINNWTSVSPGTIYAYSPDERVIIAKAYSTDEDGKRKTLSACIYQNKEQLTTIAESEVIYYTVDRLTRFLEEDGNLHVASLPDRKIVYTHTGKNRIKENDAWYYSMYLYDLKTNEQTEIKHSYNPVAIPDSVINVKLMHTEGMPEEMVKQQEKTLKQWGEILKKIRIYPTLRKIITDRNFIFAFTYTYNTANGHVVEIFDGSAGEYLHPVYFSFIPNVIKNGYAYRQNINEEGFPVVEKYKIDPAVYGK
ncbi:hypothetical protein AMJ80_03665 [bacterium SM23_31]|nr:MAG: hypothetical protein AMJ80_03665 [bacterium SM23_31]